MVSMSGYQFNKSENFLLNSPLIIKSQKRSASLLNILKDKYRHSNKISKSLLITFLSTLILMTIYETLKQLINPEITIWQSHIITIMFTSIIAPITAYFAFKEIEKLRWQGLSDLENKKKVEKELRHTRAMLEILVDERTQELKLKNEQLRAEIFKNKKVEKKLRKSESRYKLLFDLMPLIVFHYDPNLEVTEYNRYTKELFIQKFKQNKTKNLANICNRDMLNVFNIVFTGSQGSWEGEFQIEKGRDPDYINIQTVPYFENDGNIRGGIAVVEIITERHFDSLRLLEAKELAENSEKIKTNFLAQMSHEIRTPLNTILNFMMLVEGEIKNNLDGELRESFVHINSAGDRIIRTIDLLLNMSELQSNSYKYSAKLFSVSELLKGIFVEHKHLAARKKINFTLNVFTEDTVVLADDYSVTQIFSNLINNAIKFTEKGSVEVLVTRTRDDKLEVNIKDTGVGIGEVYLNNLFRPFTQEESGYTRKYEGNGLGLALVKQYCDMNKILIEVESKKGAGTLFRLEFN